MSSLPAETELVRDVLAGQSFFTGQGFFQARAQAIAKLESEIWIAQQLAQTIVDDAAHEFFELFLGKLGEVHEDGGYGGERPICNYREGRLLEVGLGLELLDHVVQSVLM